jgi:hypothetical protein
MFIYCTVDLWIYEESYIHCPVTRNDHRFHWCRCSCTAVPIGVIGSNFSHEYDIMQKRFLAKHGKLHDEGAAHIIIAHKPVTGTTAQPGTTKNAWLPGGGSIGGAHSKVYPTDGVDGSGGSAGDSKYAPVSTKDDGKFVNLNEENPNVQGVSLHLFSAPSR